MAVRESEIHTYFMTIMKQSKDSADPNVINDELIRRYIKQYNAENRIFGMDSMPFTELVELRLSFQNIIKIQNLEGMHKLKKLCLDNNIIDRIEGMDELTSLEWLDLSFNSIKVIEGLDYLSNLTDLSLFHNQISEVNGGLDACHKLNILSLGDNKIATYQQTISYLRNFKRLQVVNFAGNKICEEMYYRSYVIAMLSHLKYLDYTFIRDDERNKALEEHRDDVEEKKAQEQSQEELDKELMEKREIETLNEAFLGCTHNIIKHLQEENEEDEQKVAVLPEQPELFTDFSDKITNDTNDFQESIKKLNSKRVNMLEKFKKSVKKAVDEAEQEDIKFISEFETKEKAAIRVFEQDEDAGEESLKNLEPVVDQLEEKLIDKELELVERVNAAVDNFEKSLKVVIEEIKEEVRKYQELMNAEVEVYFTQLEKIKEDQLKAFHAENANHELFTPEQRELYKEKDQLSGAIANLQEDYKTKIYGIEDKIMKDFDNSMSEFIENIRLKQHLRNRNHVREIMDLANDKRKLIENIISGNDY